MIGKKGYGTYGGGQRKRPRWSVLVLLLVVLALAFFGYGRFGAHRLAQANKALAAGDFSAAESGFEKSANMFFSSGRGFDGLGVLALLGGDVAGAKDHFRIVLEKKPGGFGARPDVALNAFIERGLYQTGQIYVDFLTNWRDTDDLDPFALDFAALCLGRFDLDGASEALTRSGAVDEPRYQHLSKTLEGFRRDGYAPVLVDRNDKPYLVYQLDEQAFDFLSPNLFAGWRTENGDIDFANLSDDFKHNRIRTTIDINLQRAANQAMANYQGTMIMMQPDTGEILAAYGDEGHQPFTTTFEPGSVIKVLTYGALLKDGRDTAPYAPKRYPGNMQIGGKIFYDWTTQGQLDSVNEGMAVSCNLMFAQMGNDLGWSRVRSFFETFFNGEELDDLLLSANFGEITQEPEGAWDLGRISIGLDTLATSALGLVQIPAMVANSGSLVRPQMVRSVENLEGRVIQQAEPMEAREVLSGAAARELHDSMVASVTDRRGTARRARLDFVDTIMKTGTAGDRPFDTIMIGAFPEAQPKVVFAFYLNKGGKAEINGSRVARLLLEQIRALAPEYLEIEP